MKTPTPTVEDEGCTRPNASGSSISPSLSALAGKDCTGSWQEAGHQGTGLWNSHMGSGEVKERARCLEKTSLRSWCAFGTVKMSTVLGEESGRSDVGGSNRSDRPLSSPSGCQLPSQFVDC